MPVDFLTEDQQRRYGRYAGEPSPAQLERYFHLDDTDRGLIAQCRGDHNRLGFAVQLGTVRFLGTFLRRPDRGPSGRRGPPRRQLGIADTEGLKRYAAGEKRWDHAAEIRRRYGYRDFHQGSEAAALSRWLANRAWVGAERPSVLFDLATARLVERKVLLAGGDGAGPPGGPGPRPGRLAVVAHPGTSPETPASGPPGDLAGRRRAFPAVAPGAAPPRPDPGQHGGPGRGARSDSGRSEIWG